MKNLTTAIAIFLTLTVSGQELIGFDTYEQAPKGTVVYNDLKSLIEDGEIESGVMYKAEDGYGIRYDMPLSSTQNTVDILTLTHDILVANNIDTDEPEIEESDMDLDFNEYSIEDLWVDFYLGYAIRKAFPIHIGEKTYAVVLIMNLYSFELTLTEFK